MAGSRWEDESQTIVAGRSREDASLVTWTWWQFKCDQGEVAAWEKETIYAELFYAQKPDLSFDNDEDIMFEKSLLEAMEIYFEKLLQVQNSEQGIAEVKICQEIQKNLHN